MSHRKTIKQEILILYPEQDEIWKKPDHATCPFNYINVLNTVSEDDLRDAEGLLLLLDLELELVDVDGGHLALDLLRLLQVELTLPLHGLDTPGESDIVSYWSKRYTHKTSSYKMSTYQTSSYSTSRLQNVQVTKCPCYNTSRLPNRNISGRKNPNFK